MKEINKLLWESMLDIDMNYRYFGYLCRKYNNIELAAKIFVAITSSVSITSWSIWNKSESWISFQLLWQILTGISALIAVAIPILNYSKLIDKMSNLRSSYFAILNEYEIVWINKKNLSCENIIDFLKMIKNKEKDLIPLESDIPNNRKLVLKCQKLVCKSRKVG